MRFHDISTMSALALIVTIAGCGGVDFQAVSGKVTLDGAPLPGAKLFLVPKDSSGLSDADPIAKGPFLGVTDDQGQFDLGALGDPGGGVPPGVYTLTITTAWLENVTETSITPPQKVPPPHGSGVDFEVPDGGNDAANFDLKSNK
jgi:hypothetical protein